ncbi:dUTPase [Clostridium saccharobutylicum]|nr:dUTPase [Clostridium saccharobutylicum]
MILINHSQEVFKVDQGMKIAQMVIKPVFKVNVVEETELSNSERSERGFGSSGIR